MAFSPQALERTYQYDTPVASSARTASSQTSAISAGAAIETINVFVIVTAASGTSPSLTVSLEVSPDGGTTWFESAAGAALTAAGTESFKASIYDASTVLTPLYRIKWAITGTTPSFTFEVHTLTTRS